MGLEVGFRCWGVLRVAKVRVRVRVRFRFRFRVRVRVRVRVREGPVDGDHEYAGVCIVC